MPADPIQTQTTLLRHVRDAADAEAWHTFSALYREMLVRFGRSRGLQLADAEDVVQLVFARLSAGLRTFDYQPGVGRFRDYLFRCMRNAIVDLRRRQTGSSGHVALDEVADAPDTDSAAEAAFEREWVAHHYRLALERFRAASDPASFKVLEATVAGIPVAEIAATLGMTTPAVYKAQQRARDRLRELIAEQLREEDQADT